METAGPAARTGLLMRAPLALAAGLLAGGIAAGMAWELPRALWPVAMAVAVAAALLTGRRPHLHALTAGLIGASIFAAGGWRVDQCYRATRGDDILFYTGSAQSLAMVRGQVVSIPQIADEGLEAAAGYRRSPRTLLTLRARQVLTRDGWRDVTGHTAVSIQQADDRLRAGQELELVGWLGRLRGPDNPGQYDWSASARRRGLTTRLGVMGADGVTILSGPRGWAGRLWWSLRSAGRAAMDGGDDPAHQDLLAALVVGDRPASLNSLNRIMARAGLAHYLSISGSHLAVLLGMVYLACRLAGLSPRPAAVAVLVVLGAYLVQARTQAPLLRSAIQAAAVCVGAALGRRSSVLNSLSAAAILLLAIDPLQLADPGFQLSFGIVGALVVAQRPVKAALFGRYLRRRGLIVFRDSQRVRRWLGFRAADWGMEAVAMGVTAYLASAPLVAWHFGFFSPWAAGLTLAALPLVTAVLVPGYLALLVGALTPNLSWQLNRLAAGAAGMLDSAGRAMARLPLLSVDLRPVGLGWVVLSYAVLASLLLRGRLRIGWWRVAGAMAVWVLATAWTQRPAPKPAVAELNLLAVGGGQCAVLRCPSGRTVLLDAGTRSGFDVHQQVIEPFLRHRRWSRPTLAIVSHANTDHYNALFGYLGEHRLARFCTTEGFASGTGLDPAAAASADLLLSRLWEAGSEVVTLQAGGRIDLDERTYIEVLWPPEGCQAASANDTSLVLRITCDQRSVLLCGDIESAPQEALCGRGGLPRCDVLVLPHHGGWRLSLPELVRQCGAKWVLASCASDPCAAPRSDERARAFYSDLAHSGTFRCTARNGWVGVRFGRGVLEVRGAR